MAEGAWTAIGLLAATLFGGLFWLGSRMDALAGRIDGLAGRVESGFGRLDGRLDAVNARLDGVNARLDTHVRNHIQP